MSEKVDTRLRVSDEMLGEFVEKHHQPWRGIRRDDKRQLSAFAWVAVELPDQELRESAEHYIGRVARILDRAVTARPVPAKMVNCEGCGEAHFKDDLRAWNLDRDKRQLCCTCRWNEKRAEDDPEVNESDAIGDA